MVVCVSADKYYLVDVSYPNRKGFLAPTKKSVTTKQSSNGGATKNANEEFNKVL